MKTNIGWNHAGDAVNLFLSSIVSDLFTTPAALSGKPNPAEPLAARMRPRTLDEVAGQQHILAEGKLLRRAIAAVCEGRDPGDLTTMEDPAALQQIGAMLRP